MKELNHRTPQSFLNQTCVTHPGNAHRDDFLSCCVFLALGGSKIIRRLPTKEELNDSNIIVIDVGREYNNQLNNYDHHQFEINKDNPLCALSLILKGVYMYDNALISFPWMSVTERYDCLGPFTLAKEFEISSDKFLSLMSPVEKYILNIFASKTLVHKNSELGVIMCDIGVNLIRDIQNIDSAVNLMVNEKDVKLFRLEGDLYGLFFDPSFPYDPFLALDAYLSTMYQKIVVIIHKSERGEQFKMVRLKDNNFVDFRNLNDSDVDFCHNNGFMATTKDLDKDNAIRLCKLAIKGNKND